MRSKLIWLITFVIAATICIGLAACSAPASSGASKDGASTTTSSSASGTGSQSAQSSSAQSGKAIGVSVGLAENSIFTFDKNPASEQLVKDMSEAKLPVSCTVLYDQMGSLPSVTVTDERAIRNLYSLMASMKVEGATNASITDSYHRVSFKLQDGTDVSYNFEGEGVLVRPGQNYAVAGGSSLWEYVRYLQENYLREQSAGENWQRITLIDDEELVEKCPTVAPPGEVVQMLIPYPLDVALHVAVDDDENYGKFLSGDTYAFVMPDAPVTVRVWTTSEFGGA